MRLVVCALGAVGVSAISLALADPPATPAEAPAATQAPATSATAPAAAPVSAKSAPSAAAKDTKPVDGVVVQGTPDMDYLEKHFLSEGYKMEMHNGTKMFCRREEELGSRLGGQKVCGTAQQLDATEREAKAAVQRGNTQQVNPSGK